MNIDRCHKCGGDVELEVEGNFEDCRCQDCGIIVCGGRLVEADTDNTSSTYRTCPECGHTVVLSERAVSRLGEMDIGCAGCDVMMLEKHNN